MSSRAVRNISKEDLREKARMIRLETLRLTDICGSGHYGSTFSMAELVAVLYYQLLHVDPKNAKWPDRDRFTMGKGHAAIGLYPVSPISASSPSAGPMNTSAPVRRLGIIPT